jgi:hypothetical protein
MVRHLLLPLQVAIKDDVSLLLNSKHEEDLVVHLVDRHLLDDDKIKMLHLCLHLQAYAILQGILHMALVCVRTIVMISTTFKNVNKGPCFLHRLLNINNCRLLLMLLWNISVIATNLLIPIVPTVLPIVSV